ncbi:hypothetical protein LAWASA_994 [Lawsonibacter asaccharolyticus]|nr:hypothetical protein LAWASA_994 [Lawsonibacter asaccharolyticus]
MRNLKRALSLALASVMLLGMMVVGSSAKGIDDFTDKAEIVNQDAVAVTSAIGMFEGYEDGSFGPENVVTRAEMAVIICTMLYGAGVNVNQFAETSVFTDVPAWAQGYVNLCSSLGIVAGVGDGKFDPNATVTTAQAVLMLCRALGYFQSAADFGSDWMLAATAKGTALGLYGDLKLTANAGLTRDNVAELVFNALTKAVPVQYNELLGVYYNENQGIIYSLEFNYLQTLGYKNFDLVYRTDTETIYGRPATTWGTGTYNVKTEAGSTSKTDNLTENGGLIASKVRMLDKDEIITVPNAPTYTYTSGQDIDEVYKDLGKSVCTLRDNAKDEGYTWTAYVNGKEDKDVDDNIPTSKDDSTWKYTGKGTVTEIYIDDADATVTVVEINYYLGQVSKVKSDSKGEYVTVKAISTEPKLDDNDFYAEGYEEDDYVVFTVDYNEDEDFYICELMAPETVNGEVTRVEKDKDAETGKGETGETYLKLADGAKYSYSGDGHIVYDLDDDNVKAHPALNEQYTLYLDPNGYVLGFVQETGSTQYLYVKDSDEELRDWVAKVVLADATSVKADLDDEYKDGKKKVKIEWIDEDGDSTNIGKDRTNIDEKVWAYTVGEDKIYTLKAVDSKTMTNAEINNGKAYISDGKNDFIVDKKTVFVDVEGETAYTGYNEVPDVDNATLAYVLSTKNGNVAEIVFIVDGDVYDSASTYFMLSKTTRESLKYDGDYYWEYTNAYVNGVKQSVYVDQDLGALEVGHLYKATKTVDEKYITGIEDVELKDNTVNARGDGAFWLTTVEDAKMKYDVDDDTVFVYVDVEPKNGENLSKGYDYTITDGDVKNMYVGSETETYDGVKFEYKTYVTVVKDSNDHNTADLVYIIHKPVPPATYDITVKVNGVEDTKLSLKDKEAGTYTVEYTLPAGQNLTSVTGGTYTVDGQKVTITVPVTNADVTVEITTDKAPAVYTLTLKGNLMDTTKPATVWTGASTEIEGTPIKEFGKVTAVEYKVPENAAVTIMDGDITDVGTVRINGILIDTNAGELTFTMSDDLTLTGAPTAGAAVFTLTAGEGIVLKDADGNEITGPVASGTQVTVESETGYYLQDKVAGAGVADTTKVTVSANTAVYAASKVELKQGAAATYGTSNTSVTDGNYVALGTELKVTAAGKSGVVVGTTGDAITTYVVTKDDVVLNGAWKVELTDVTATISGKAIGAYVADGQTLTATVATGAGTSVIEVKGNNKFATTAFTTGTVSADLELAAATSVKVGNGSGEVTYEGSNGKDIEVLAANANTTAYVMPGTVLTVKNAGTITGADDVTAEGVFQTFTVGTVAIEIENP